MARRSDSFPVDAETLKYLRLSGRDEHQVRLVEEYSKAQGMFRDDNTSDPEFTDSVSLDLSTVEPSLAGPKRPQDRVPLSASKKSFNDAWYAEMERIGTLAGVIAVEKATAVSASTQLATAAVATDPAEVMAKSGSASVTYNGQEFALKHGAVVIAAITSCTNTSNPSVMLGAGLLAKKAVALGLKSKPWVKTSLAPGSKVVTDYYEKAGVMNSLEALGFYLAGYGCTTCIGNSGPLPQPIVDAVEAEKLIVCAVLSGNRNFEGRVNPHTRFNYLASPPLVVAYALAGRMDIDFATEPLGIGTNGPVFLRDVWPSPKEVEDTVLSSITSAMFQKQYGNVFDGDEHWQSLPFPTGDRYTWSKDSTYVANPPFFDGMTAEVKPVAQVRGARVLAMLGDSITTDHISPAGSIPAASPAGKWLIAHGVPTSEFNSYGARRGHHEVMMRGTFANIRLRNELAPGTEGGRERFVGADTPLVYFDGNSLGRPLVVTGPRLAAFVEDQWGGRLIRGWDEAWLDLPLRVGDELGRVALGAAPGQVALGTPRRSCSTSSCARRWPLAPAAPRSCSTATSSRPTATSPPAWPRSAGSPCAGSTSTPRRA